jgi:hypothetical protein
MPTYEDIAFKVIVKNDGISDVIFKTLMLKGEAGGTISSIEKTSSVGVVDTYTITLNDGTTTTFEVTNGSNIASIEKTATAGLIDTYTVTLTNGDTSTFEVKNGEDAQLYELPKDCVVGYDKEPTQTTVTSSERYIQLDDVNGISSVKYNGSTLQATNDGRNLFDPENLSATGITIDDGVVSGNIGYFYNAFKHANGGIPNLPTFETNTSYTLSFQIKYDENTHPSGSLGIGFRVDYTDNTYEQLIPQVGLQNTSYISVSGTTNPNKTVSEIAVNYSYSATVYLRAIQLEKGSTATAYQPYCGGIPAPNPDYPQEIVGVGEKQQDNTYSVDLVAEDSDGNVYTVTASGLTHPVYAGDWIDLVAGKLYRSKGFLTKTIADMNNSEDYAGWKDSGIRALMGEGINQNYTKPTIFTNVGNVFAVNTTGSGAQGLDVIVLPKSQYGLTQSQWIAQYSDLTVTFVFPLETPTEEDITLTGDLEQVKRIRGEYVFIDAPLYASTDITFGQETDFPDGYEEIDFPLDDLFYYQDQEYIEFPTSWGFVMGYVFDASEIRFTMNVTKDLKEGFNVVANKSVDLALNLYTGAGGSNLTGFNFVDASFIREYGQIQIRLKTENPHGLTVGSLLGARVSQGRLRITFEAPQEE